MHVIDASVITKWYITEENSDKAVELRRLHEAGTQPIHIPELLFFELTNTFVNTKKLVQSEINNSIESLVLLELQVSSFDMDDYKNLVLIAREFHISSYDASYVYLAQKLHVDLITADIKLFTKTKKLGFIKLL